MHEQNVNKIVEEKVIL